MFAQAGVCGNIANAGLGWGIRTFVDRCERKEFARRAVCIVLILKGDFCAFLRLLAQLARVWDRDLTRGVALRERNGVRTDRGLAGTAEGSFVFGLLSRRNTDKLGQYWLLFCGTVCLLADRVRYAIEVCIG